MSVIAAIVSIIQASSGMRRSVIPGQRMQATVVTMLTADAIVPIPAAKIASDQ
jgi:hypothetical protein